MARKLLRLQAYVLGALALWLLVVEVGLRFVPVPRLAPEDLDPVDRLEEALSSQPHPYFAAAPKPSWRSPDGRVTHDERGFRGTASEGSGRRILCLGGASTYGEGLADEETWPARLAVHLGERPEAEPAQVVNAAFPGWSSFENTLNLAFRCLSLDPDEVVLYLGDEDVRCALYGEPAGDNTHWRTVWPVFCPAPIEPLLERSVTYRIARRYLTDWYETRSDGRVITVLGLDPDDPDPLCAGEVPRRGIASFERNLRSMIGIAREHGVRVVLVSAGFAAERVAGLASGPNQARVAAEMAEIVERLAGEYGVGFVDGARLLAEPPCAPRFASETLLSAQGADELARAVAEHLAR